MIIIERQNLKIWGRWNNGGIFSSCCYGYTQYPVFLKLSKQTEQHELDLGSFGGAPWFSFQSFSFFRCFLFVMLLKVANKPRGSTKTSMMSRSQPQNAAENYGAKHMYLALITIRS